MALAVCTGCTHFVLIVPIIEIAVWMSFWAPSWTPYLLLSSVAKLWNKIMICAEQSVVFEPHWCTESYLGCAQSQSSWQSELIVEELKVNQGHLEENKGRCFEWVTRCENRTVSGVQPQARINIYHWHDWRIDSQHVALLPECCGPVLGSLHCCRKTLRVLI